MARKKGRRPGRGLNFKSGSVSYILIEHQDRTPAPGDEFTNGGSVNVRLSSSTTFSDWEVFSWGPVGDGRYLLIGLRALRDVPMPKGGMRGAPPAPGTGDDVTVTVVVDNTNSSDVKVDPYSE